MVPSPHTIPFDIEILRFMIRPVLAALVLTGLGVPNAEAQTVPSPYRDIERGQEAGFFAGQLSVATGQFDLGPRAGTAFGGWYALEVGGPVFIEGRATLLSTERDVIDPRRVEGDRSIGRTDMSLFLIDARLAFSLTGRRTWRGLSPYIFAGGGLGFDGTGAGDLDQQLLPEDRFDFGTSFTTSFGGGLRYAISEALMLRTDAGLTLWQLPTPTGFDNPDRDLGAVPENEWVGGLGVVVGLSWRF